MKRIMLVFCLLLSGLLMDAQTVLPASDGQVTWLGRVQVQGDTVRFDWSGTSVRVKFSGTCLKMRCSDTGTDYFNVWTDRQPTAVQDAVIRTSGAEQEVVLVSGLRKGTHEVLLQKRTEGRQGLVSVTAFSTDGKFLPAEGLRERHIEFIGDSYTCGYGTEAADRKQPFRAEEENCNLAYAAILGRYFDADVNLVSHSGIGIVRCYGDSDMAPMPSIYGQAFDSSKEAWDFRAAPYRPDIVVIYLGTNDFSTGKQPGLDNWCKAYANLLKQVRAAYGEEVPIFCVGSMASRLMGQYVETAVRESGVKNIRWTAIHTGAHNGEADLGASYHPNYRGQRKVASCMAPYIATLTGWDLPFKVLE